MKELELEIQKWKKRFEREREARKEAEKLLEDKTREIFYINQELEKKISDRAKELKKTLDLLDRYVITSITDENGVIIDVSSAFCEISGYSKDELIGKKHSIVRHTDTEDVLYNQLWSTIRSGRVWQGEIKNKSKSGKEYWIKATISPNIKNGVLKNFVSVIQDITASKKLQQASEHMILQSRHAAMGEMISMIAHQWRQPLSTINTIISDIVVQKELGIIDIDNSAMSSLKEIVNFTSHLSNTINDFRNFFTPNKDSEKINIKNIIDETIHLSSYMLKNNNIEFITDFKDDIIIDILKNEFIQVLINIIKNSRDQLVDNNIDNKRIKFTGFLDNNDYIIEVSDNGGGIDKAHIKKIFEPYFSTKSKNGTGLGLYMAKLIICDHLDGAIEALNTDDGAMIRIKIPIKKENYESN